MRVAIIGAGLAGATTARTLVDAGADVVVFDKSRGVGGRMATRRAPHDAAVTFDHGAQYFTARDPRFAERVAAWYEQGLVARLAGPIAVFEAAKAPTTSSPKDRWVGVPERAMSSSDGRRRSGRAGLTETPRCV